MWEIWLDLGPIVVLGSKRTILTVIHVEEGRPQKGTPLKTNLTNSKKNGELSTEQMTFSSLGRYEGELRQAV